MIHSGNAGVGTGTVPRGPFHNMATIYNTELFKEIKDGAKIQQMTDAIPSQLQGTVVPVMEVNPKLLRKTNFISGSTSSATGALSVITASTSVDTFITNLNVNLIKDATCDQATGVVSIACTQDGIGKTLIRIPVITLTAQVFNMEIGFMNPIKVDRGSVITFSTSYSVGVMVRSAQVQGFTLENNNA